VLTARGGGLDRAIAYFREGLRLDPLHPGLLHAIADVLTQGKRFAAALQHYTQALLLVSEPRRRAQLYARLGALWDEQLGMPDEAGACYDLAVAHGTDDSEVMLRALAYYRRSGRHEAATRMIDRLLPRATTPATLAALWSERASLLSSIDAAQAVEAFDMALSYDPACRPAVDGLADLLERRGEWQQLVELLEGRLEGGAPPERAVGLRRLARIARLQHDDATAEIHLQRALTLDPQPEDFDALLEIVGSDAARERDRAALQAARLALVGPFVPALAQLGSRLAAAGERRRAWCVLSPLTTTIIQEPALKSLVLELRKELEKSDTLAQLTPQLHLALMPPEVAPPLLDVLAELDELLPVGPATVEAAGARRCTRIDGKVPLGKTFATIAEQLGMPQALLTRADELPGVYRVLDGDVPHVVVRTDLLGSLAPGETHALLATLLELSRPGVRMLSTQPPEEAAQLLAALMGAVGQGADEDVAALQQQISDAAGRERLERWSAELSGIERATAATAAALVEGARRVGLVAAGELRFAARLVARLDESEVKLPTTGSAEDLEKFFAGAPAARRLLAFAVSPTLTGIF
jgi:tetratricopeptide (TPR) repeat protein